MTIMPLGWKGTGSSSADFVWRAPCTVLLNTLPVEREGFRSFLRGAVETFNLSGDTRHCYYLFSTGDDADVAAIQNDWDAVGGDLGAALAGAARGHD